MIIKNLKNFKFRDKFGIYVMDGFALYVEGKGFVSLDGQYPYSPICGRLALKSIIETGLTEEPAYIMPI